jgi:hypothetical protein
MNNRIVTIIVTCTGDDASTSILKSLEDLSAKQILAPFFVIQVDPKSNNYETDIIGRFISGDGAENCVILDRLARYSNVDLLRIVGVDACQPGPSLGIERAISGMVKHLNLALGMLLSPSTRVTDIRIGVRAFDEKLPTSEFFPINSNCNIVIIPQDRKTDNGIARQITRPDKMVSDSTFILHGATEIASMIGLWRSMDHAPVDKFAPSVSGTSVPRVRFGQSRVRILIGPPIPMTKIAQASSDLPLPIQHFAVGNPRVASKTIASAIYPKTLMFTKSILPDFGTRIGGGLSAFLLFLSEMARSIINLPKILVKGIQDEFDAAASELHQEMIGQDSWMRIAGADQTNGGKSVGLSTTELDSIVQEIEAMYDRELISPIGRDEWLAMVGSFLGALDGADDQKLMRQEILSNENILLVDRGSIGQSTDSLAVSVSKLLKDFQTEEEARLRDIKDEQDALSDNEKQAQIAIEIDVKGAPKLTAAHRNEISQVGSPSPIDQTDDVNNLSELVSACFTRERLKAKENVRDIGNIIRSLSEKMKANEIGAVSSWVSIASWIALCGLVFVVATCTPVRELLDFFPSDFVRDASFTAFSSIFVVAALVMLGVGGQRSWQSRALLTGGVVGVFVACLVAFFRPIRDFLKVNSEQPWIATVLALATIGLMVAAIARNISSKSLARREIGRLFALATSIYLVVSVIFWQSMEFSYMENVENGTRQRLLLAGVIISGALLIASVCVVSVVHLRERLRLRQNAEMLEWARSEMEMSVEAHRRLAAAQVQWAATGSVLTRLVAYPLGKSDYVEESFVDTLSSDEATLKFDVARLKLNEHGEAGLIARLRRHFVERGWLVRQYEKMVSKYQHQAAFKSGNRPEDLIDRRPEVDPVVVSVADALSLRHSSDRWDFAEKVFAGEFDSLLAAVPEQLSLEEVYQSVLDNEESYVLIGSQVENIGAREFLSQVLPSPVVDLPTGLVERTFIGGDITRRLSTELWWPADVLGDPVAVAKNVKINESQSLASSYFDTSVVLVGVRVDLSEPFSYPECLGSTEVIKFSFEAEDGSKNKDF